MAQMKDLKQGAAPGVLVANIRHRRGDGPFSRADLIFEGVDHSGPSYEVRVYRGVGAGRIRGLE
jgi:hypothetical protein